jgi:hypothetical protein
MGAVPLAILQDFRRKQLSFNILISIAFPLSLSTNRTSMAMTRFSQTDFSRDCEVTIPDRQDDSRKVISRWSDAGRCNEPQESAVDFLSQDKHAKTELSALLSFYRILPRLTWPWWALNLENYFSRFMDASPMLRSPSRRKQTASSSMPMH